MSFKGDFFLLALFLMCNLLNRGKIMSWNVRGAANVDFVRNCKQYLDIHHLDIFIIMETRCDPANLKRSFFLLGFDGFVFSQANGFAGGIVVGWKSADVQATVLCIKFQFIHLKVSFFGGPSSYLTAVYASPHEENRRYLWEDLHYIAVDMQDKWCLVGDFNDITNLSEKKGGAEIHPNKMQRFADRINSCGLLDLGASGPRFTWRGGLYTDGERTFKRLDRALGNDAWRLGFPNAIVKVLPRIEYSDHHPLIIYMQHSYRSHRPRCFKFKGAWLTDNSFQDMLSRHWDPHRSVPQNIRYMEQVFLEWKKDTVEYVSNLK